MGLKSFFVLGFQFFLHLFRRVFHLAGKRRADEFIAEFRSEGLLPFEAKDRALVPQWQRCTACGLCEAACPAIGSPTTGLKTPSYAYLAACQWRDVSACHLAVDSALQLERCGDCIRCEQACPQHIPLKELARFVVEMASRR